MFFFLWFYGNSKKPVLFFKGETDEEREWKKEKKSIKCTFFSIPIGRIYVFVVNFDVWERVVLSFSVSPSYKRDSHHERGMNNHNAEKSILIYLVGNFQEKLYQRYQPPLYCWDDKRNVYDVIPIGNVLFLIHARSLIRSFSSVLCVFMWNYRVMAQLYGIRNSSFRINHQKGSEFRTVFCLTQCTNQMEWFFPSSHSYSSSFCSFFFYFLVKPK